MRVSWMDIQAPVSVLWVAQQAVNGVIRAMKDNKLTAALDLSKA